MDADIETVKKFMQQENSAILAYLFGSRVTNNCNGRSDWDVGVYFKQESIENERWHDLNVEGELSRALKGTAQIINLNNPVSPLLGYEIIKNGIILKNTNEEMRLDIENKLLRDYYDWSYYFNRKYD